MENRRAEDQRINEIRDSCQEAVAKARHIDGSLHDLDKRVAVVETRQSVFEARHVESHKLLDQKIDGVHEGIKGLGADFKSHTAAEASDRKRLMWWLAGLVVSMLSMFGLLLLKNGAVLG